MTVAASVAVIAPTMAVAIASVTMAMETRAAHRLVTNRRTGDHHPGRAVPRRDIHRRRTERRLTNDHAGQGRKRYSESDADVDPGLGEGQAAYENRCNEQYFFHTVMRRKLRAALRHLHFISHFLF